MTVKRSTVTISLKLPRVLRDRLRQLADREMNGLSATIRRILAASLDEPPSHDLTTR